LKEILQSYPAYRRRQAEEAVFQRLIEDWDEATNLPLDLRQKLKSACPLGVKAEVLASARGDSAKAAIELSDGAVIETVLMRHQSGRNTICLSSQVGCPGACAFCATGQMGFVRQLTAEEIVAQILFFSRLLKKEGGRISSAVFMGMGEPLLNYREVMLAVDCLNDRNKFNIGARHISLSTIGIPVGIERLSREKKQINLAFSLHAPDDALRGRLIPLARQHPLREILAALKNYIDATGRRVMVEYVLLDGVNDSPPAARDLARLLRQSLERLFFVNLISFNPTLRYRPTTPQKMKIFQSTLEREGIAVTCRYRFGEDIDGACGQLAGRKKP